MTPKEALKNLWAICMEAPIPLKNYEIAAQARQVLEAIIKKETQDS